MVIKVDVERWRTLSHHMRQPALLLQTSAQIISRVPKVSDKNILQSLPGRRAGKRLESDKKSVRKKASPEGMSLGKAGCRVGGCSPFSLYQEIIRHWSRTQFSVWIKIPLGLWLTHLICAIPLPDVNPLGDPTGWCPSLASACPHPQGGVQNALAWGTPQPTLLPCWWQGNRSWLLSTLVLA